MKKIKTIVYVVALCMNILIGGCLTNIETEGNLE